MQYILSFLQGVITFISPCVLPMLPVYISYFAGGEERGTAKTIKNVLGFTLGFTIVFACFGALAGTVGYILINYRILLNILTGLVMVFFGLSYMGVFHVSLFRGAQYDPGKRDAGFFSSALFGLVFFIVLAPCAGAFLASTMALAAQEGSVLKGMALLLVYAAGLAIPFLVSAVLIDKLKGIFGRIKRNYKTINLVCGGLLVVIGILMMTGLLTRLMARAM